jgi:tripartite-type tricarboxylate transporter receptor subunit TctC
MITTIPSVLGLLEASQVRPLAVTGKTRSRKFPDVPIVAESGWPNYEATAWYGFVVPKGTPKEITARIRTATIETIRAGVVRERLEAEGAEPIGNDPEEFAAMMRTESARWAEIVRQASITMN